MQTIEILDIKPFMQLIFQTAQFDSYEFVSATLRTDMTYELDGHINREFFTEEEYISINPSDSAYLNWQIAKDKVFQLIKGKKTPSILKIVLRMNETMTADLCNTTHSSLSANDIDGMFLNILFQNGSLNVVCGISYKIFTLDKNLEQEFTEAIANSFRNHQITFQK